MSYDVRWMPRARRQAAATQTWWVANRESAPTMFRDELGRVIALLQANPDVSFAVETGMADVWMITTMPTSGDAMVAFWMRRLTALPIR